MQVGDLVKPDGISWPVGLGILVDLVSDDPIVRERYWIVQWSNGTRDTLRERFLKVVNASG